MLKQITYGTPAVWSYTNLSQSRVGGRGARAEAFGVSRRAIVPPSADLGGSSDYSVENTED